MQFEEQIRNFDIYTSIGPPKETIEWNPWKIDCGTSYYVILVKIYESWKQSMGQFLLYRQAL